MAYVVDQDIFNSPDEYTDQYIGFKLPFSFGKIDNALHDNTIDSIKDNLENLFNTEPGERIFHPMLGDRNQYRISVDFHIIKNPAMRDSVEVVAEVGGY
jgi:hypothetical protein